MTTEVLRNMLYAGSPTLGGLGYVVMDEVHYLADRFRGAVWEEVIIHLPESVRLVSLSATVSNAEEFGDWLVTVRGDTEVIVEEHRPVPLWQHVHGRRDRLLRPVRRRRRDRRSDVNPELVAARPRRGALRAGRRPHAAAARRRRRRAAGSTAAEPGRGGRAAGPRRACCRRSRSSSAGPAATRRSQQCLRSRAAADHAGRARARSAASSRSARADIPDEDLARARLPRVARRARARHRRAPRRHAADVQGGRRGAVRPRAWSRPCSPPRRWRSASTCRPARVVLEKLVKWNGETHADVTPGEYTQLTGRAGRRGIDVEGHAVVLWQPGLDPTRGRPGSPRPAPIRCGRASGRRTTWPSTWSAQVGRRHGPRAARVVVRAVPGRPRRRRAGPAGAAQRGGARRLPRGDDLPPRRLRGVRRRCAARSRTARPTLARAGRRPAQGRGRRVAGGAAARRRDPGARPAGARASRSSSTRAAATAPDGPAAGRC